MDAALAHSLPAGIGAPALARPGPQAAGAEAAARAAAQDFEAVFLSAMLEGMFEGLDTEPPFGGGHAEKTYRSLLVSEYAGDMARSGGIGIADSVYREILAAQEGATP